MTGYVVYHKESAFWLSVEGPGFYVEGSKKCNNNNNNNNNDNDNDDNDNDNDNDDDDDDDDDDIIIIIITFFGTQYDKIFKKTTKYDKI